MRYFTLLLIAFSFTMSSCKDKKSDTEKIEEYLAENNITATSTPSGLYYVITQEGSGGHPNLQSQVTVKYKGYLLNGDVFDQTTGNKTVEFLLHQVILGWQEGIQLMKKGGKAMFFIPSELGYGSQPKGSIPANSVLIFEVELVNF